MHTFFECKHLAATIEAPKPFCVMSLRDTHSGRKIPAKANRDSFKNTNNMTCHSERINKLAFYWASNSLLHQKFLRYVFVYYRGKWALILDWRAQINTNTKTLISNINRIIDHFHEVHIAIKYIYIRYVEKTNFRNWGLENRIVVLIFFYSNRTYQNRH